LEVERRRRSNSLKGRLDSIGVVPIVGYVSALKALVFASMRVADLIQLLVITHGAAMPPQLEVSREEDELDL
jgi:hypothetical protein